MAWYPDTIYWTDPYPYTPGEPLWVGALADEYEQKICEYDDATGETRTVKEWVEVWNISVDEGPGIGEGFTGKIWVYKVTEPSNHPDFNIRRIKFSIISCDMSDGFIDEGDCYVINETNTSLETMEEYIFGTTERPIYNPNRWPGGTLLTGGGEEEEEEEVCHDPKMKVVLDNGNFGKLTFIDAIGCFHEIPIICGRKNGTASAPNGYYSFDPEIRYYSKKGFGGNGAYAGPFTGEAADELCGKDGLLFHNDGGGMGTNGCIGIQQPYWDEWEEAFKGLSKDGKCTSVTFSISNAAGNVRTANKVNEDGSIRPDCFIRYNANGSITVGKKVTR